MKTKNIFKVTTVAGLLSLGLGMNSCIEQTFPESSTVTADQIADSPAGMQAMLNAVVGYINTYNSYGNGYNFDFGYSAFGMTRETMGEDFFVYKSNYDYFSTFGTCRTLAESSTVNSLYYFYYKFLNNANNLIRLIDPETTNETNKQYLGRAKTFRAMIYMDISRFFEYKKTGIAKLDNEAEANKVYGLTVPIIYEDMPETDARNNPRAPFYTMYEYILNDLNKAEELLQDYVRPTKNMPDLTVIYGLKARFWLELGSRFEKYPNDLSALTQNVQIGINSATDCYDKAIEYAKKARSNSNASPLTEEEWFGGKNYTTAFNSIQTGAWLWGSIMNQENIHSTWLNYAGNICSEQTFGVGNTAYWACRTISKNLFDQIPDTDWRKTTWIAPEDAGKAPGNKYHTILSESGFKLLPPYTHLKFKPKEGNMIDANVGAPIDYLMMRVEEMYFIEAEALGASQGVAAGVNALQNFMTTYRYPEYTCNATTLEEFRKELILQKRIEFWGEGIIFWDYKRLELPVKRGYPGTNAPVGYRMNSIEGYCAPWFNVFFSKYESLQNKAIVLNPDPSSAIEDWTE